MRILSSLLLSCFVAGVTHGATVWAPGVSEDGGWYDYDKQLDSETDKYGTVMSMCWAASASNVISWWSYHNSDSITSAAPNNPWLVYQAICYDVGGYPSMAYEHWINGTSPKWDETQGDYVWPNHIDLTYEAKKEGGGGDVPSAWYAGGFLKDVYNDESNPIIVKQGISNSYEFARSMVDALASGYALTLSTTGSAAHAWTLWGVNYMETEEGIEIKGVWVTDSDDGKNDLPYYEVVQKEGAISMVKNSQSYEINTMAGMRTTKVVPEPATATLSLLALAGLAARRRRK